MYSFKYYMYKIEFSNGPWYEDIVFNEKNNQYYIFTFYEYKSGIIPQYDYVRRYKNYHIYIFSYPANSDVFIDKF